MPTSLPKTSRATVNNSATPNTTTIYVTSIVDTSDGPIIIHIPPGILGLMDDERSNMCQILDIFEHMVNINAVTCQVKFVAVRAVSNSIGC